MSFIISNNSYTWVASAMSITLRVALIIIALLVALGLGLLLRRLLVRRLKRTVLDNWLIQTLGVVVVFPPIILAAAGSPLIWDPYLILYYWTIISPQLKIEDIKAISFNVIGTLLLFALGVGIARTAKTLTIRGLSENRIDINIRTLIARVFYYIILALTIFWILTVWQIPITIPVTTIGVLTVAITVAIQDILKDLVAGFYILIERPFRIGDQISAMTTVNYVGKVEDVQLRATRLRLVSGEEVTIPNSLVFGSAVINNTFYGERRATISVALPEEEFTKGETLSQLVEMVKHIERVEAKPEPTALLVGFADKHAQITVRFWVASGQYATVSDVVYELRQAFPNATLTVKESAGDV
jgi:small-conductance mechanosensitive channel